MTEGSDGARGIRQDGPRADAQPETGAAERYGGWPPRVNWAWLTVPLAAAAAYVALHEATGLL